MQSTTQYVISRKYPATEYTPAAGSSSRTQQIREELGNFIVESDNYDIPYLVNITAAEAADLANRFPHLIIEPNHEYRIAGSSHWWIDKFSPQFRIASSSGFRRITITVVEHGTEIPLVNTSVHLMFDGAHSNSRLDGITDGSGCWVVDIPTSSTRCAYLAVDPPHGYWSRLLRGVELEDTVKVALRALPDSLSEIYDWGHEFTQMRDEVITIGGGIKVAIIDTGIRDDHEDVMPAGGVNCVQGEDRQSWNDDENGHGTHCAGIIAALFNQKGIKGYVPNASMYAYRVVGRDGVARSFDLIKAIDEARRQGCDIINISLASLYRDEAVAAELRKARDQGILCVAAAGNSSGSVEYPAAFSSVIAVSAFGKYGTYPLDSLHSHCESKQTSKDGKYFLAEFSNTGPAIRYCAPGVAIRSTVPGGYRVLDGTSMASPHLAGVAALVLAANPQIRDAPRTAKRVDDLIYQLDKYSQRLGFETHAEGKGCPSVSQILAHGQRES